MLLFSKQLSFSSVETDRCCDVDALQYSVLYEKIRRKIIDDSTFGGKRKTYIFYTELQHE